MAIERIPITDRATWLALRTRDVTASAAAALLGAHPYLSAYALWAEKTGLMPPDGEANEAMERGTELEPVARRWIAKKNPRWKITEPAAYYRDPAARLGATPDCFAEDPERGLGVLQIKSVEPSAFRRNWRGESGAIEPPLYAVIQAIVEAHLTGAAWAGVAALVVGHGIELSIVDVPLHAGIIERVRSETAAFWRMVESGKAPDPDYGHDGAILAAVYAEADGSEIDLRGDNEIGGLLAERAAISADMSIAKKRADEIKAALLHKFGTASLIRVPGGVVTAKTVRRKSYTVADTSYRDIRFRPDKEHAA